jgi:hypothetical protein
MAWDMRWVIDWTSVGSIATAIAVLIAAWQLRRGTVQARTDFEDDLSREYRELARSIPVNALLGRELPEPEFEEALPALYRYVDLSNEQVFLRMQGRICRATWNNWLDGIRSNFERPAFAMAWSRVKTNAKGSFSELRKLEDGQFKEDPRRWVPIRKRFAQWISA